MRPLFPGPQPLQFMDPYGPDYSQGKSPTYSTFNNTNCVKATAQYQNRTIFERHFIIEFSDVSSV